MKIKVCEQREKRVQLREKERWNKERRATKNIQEIMKLGKKREKRWASGA
jgi:hypothetical protein